MTKAGFPIRVYVLAAGIIAAGGFLVGTFFPGLGVAFVAGATTLWTAFAVSRQRRTGGSNG